MKTYGAIDLHSNNSVIVVIDEQDKILLKRKVPNSLGAVLDALSIVRDPICGIAVESTYNWYWLVDGLQEAGYHVDLVNTSAVKQYEGLKYSNDESDAFHLAHLLRLGILPTGYIYPQKERAVRDLLRKRLQLVQQQTAQLLSIQNQLTRNTGQQFSANAVKKLTSSDIKHRLKDTNIQQALLSNLAVMNVLRANIKVLEKMVLKQVELKPEFQKLVDIPGIGIILALTIMLETGDISRFEKAAKTKRIVALKALSHKLARACYYVTSPFLAYSLGAPVYCFLFILLLIGLTGFQSGLLVLPTPQRVHRLIQILMGK